METIDSKSLKIKQYSWKQIRIEKEYQKEITEQGNISSSMIEIETAEGKIAYLRELKTKIVRERARYQYDLIALGSTVYEEEEAQLYKIYKQHKR